jgi:hypothetical protein
MPKQSVSSKRNHRWLLDTCCGNLLRQTVVAIFWDRLLWQPFELGKTINWTYIFSDSPAIPPSANCHQLFRGFSFVSPTLLEVRTILLYLNLQRPVQLVPIRKLGIDMDATTWKYKENFDVLSEGPLLPTHFPTKGLRSKHRSSPCIFQGVCIPIWSFCI